MIKILLILLLSLPATAQYKIKPNSKFAKLCSKLHKEPELAVVVGKTIYLSCDVETFVSDSTWFKHELMHLKQYERYGKKEFLQRYLFYWIIYGYKKHPFERSKIKS